VLQNEIYFIMFSSRSTKFTSFQTTQSFHKDNTVTIKRTENKNVRTKLIQAAFS